MKYGPLPKLLWFVFVAAALAVVTAASKNEIRIEIDTSKAHSQSEVTVWTAYFLERTAFRSKHNVPVPARGEVTPSFEEETFARSETLKIYDELKAQDRNFHDSYWEAVSGVKKAGFMRAYVWTYLRRSDWPDTERPSDLTQFARWKESHLKNHRPPMMGRLVVDK